ncbi:conserved hypothetical protein [Ruegeria lacuscaerulensis ITI-1157]|nr:conserved hypothetical protein [Ruegeria lacuscaerulensis ITI-1157]SHI95728.1 hypothetical protein SAMN05444404_1087 [Ruegeria lacuscaerulensis ITI-1157]
MQVAIHSGAAFTDEGGLLKSLQENGQTLRDHGVALYGPRRYRQAIRAPLQALEAGATPAASIESLRKAFPDGPGLHRTILSSPDFLGEISSAIRDGQFYPSAGQRIAFLDQAFSGHQLELFLGLRNPGSFIPKVLAALPEEERQEILKTTDLSCLSWLSVIEDIRDLAPQVSITVWANEDTPLIWGDIIRNLSALPEETPLKAEFDLLSSLVSPAGQREIRAIAEQDPPRDPATLKDRLAAVFEAHAVHEEIEEELDLPGWSDDIIDAFTVLYSQDLARLRSMPDVRVLGR